MIKFIRICLKKTKKLLLKKWFKIWSKVDSKSLQYDEWKKWKTFKIRYYVSRFILSQGKVYFDYKKSIEDVFNLKRSTLNYIKPKHYYFSIFAISIVIFYYLNLRFNIIKSLAENCFQKIFYCLLYTWSTYFILYVIITSLLNLFWFKYLTAYKRFFYLTCQTIRTLTYAIASYFTMLIITYKVYKNYEFIINRIEEISINSSILTLIIFIIKKYKIIKFALVWTLAGIFTLTIYRLYIPVLTKTGEILQFKVNSRYDYKSAIDRVKLACYHKLLIILFMLGGMLKCASINDSNQINGGIMGVTIGLFLHLIAIFIIEYKMEKELRIRKVKPDRS